MALFGIGPKAIHGRKCCATVFGGDTVGLEGAQSGIEVEAATACNGVAK